MVKDDDKIHIQFVKCKIPKMCACPSCGMRQPVKIYDRYVKKVKALDTDSQKVLAI